MRADEVDRAQLLNEVDALPTEMAGRVFLIAGVAGHPLAVGQQGRQVRHRCGTLQAEGRPRRPVTCEAGSAGQRTNGSRAAIETRAADLARFEQGDVRAEFAGLQGSGDSGWPTAYHEQADLSVHQQVPVSGPHEAP